MSIGTKSKINELIKSKDFRIKKKFGQNFLVDQNILKKIVDSASITEDTLVVEIGPGLGSLTEHLVNKAKHVLAYEIDKDLIPILNNIFKEEITIINDDYLKRDVDKDIEDLKMDFDKVVMVANLPYYITTPIIFKTLEESNKISELLLMMQLEVARRLTSKPKTKDYNSLSIAIQYKTDAEIALKVPKTVFIPAPNVDSAVVKLVVKNEREITPKNEQFYFKLVKASFKQRRKTLVNNLHSTYNLPKVELQGMLSNLGFREDVRAEHLDMNEFITISDELENLL